MFHAHPRRSRSRSAGRQTLRWMLGGALLLSSGCASGRDPMVAQMQDLELRVSELERTNRHLTQRLGAYADSLELLEDQVRSARLAQGQSGRAGALPTVRVAPAEARREVHTIRPSSPVAYPSSSQEIHLEGDGDGEYEEIVVSDELVRQYTGQSGVSHGGGARRSDSGGRRQPYESVVRDDRLPVQPMNADRSGVEPSAPEDPLDLYRRGLELYRQADYQGAIGAFDAFLASGPSADYVDNALYWLGDAYYGMGDYAQAAGYFHRIVQEFPDANKVPDALLKVGLTYQRLDKPESAREVMYYLIEAFPRSEAARAAREKLDEDE